MPRVPRRISVDVAKASQTACKSAAEVKKANLIERIRQKEAANKAKEATNKAKAAQEKRAKRLRQMARINRLTNARNGKDRNKCRRDNRAIARLKKVKKKWE